jgi:DNA (cytosine-5)-methyltransferase 1
MGKLKILELFGGIGACSKALERLSIDYEIADYVEIDKYAVKSFNAMHNTNFEPQDITQWDKEIDVDLIMHGSPCQDFSLAGLQAGGDEGSGTRSSLMYETIRIVEKLKPKYVIWENVKNLLSKKHRHNFDSYLEIMEKLGYANYYQVLNAKDYGIPQNRERVFTVSIRNDIDIDFIFPKKQELKLRLKDMLEDNVDEKYYLDDKWLNDIRYNNNTVCETRYDEGIRTFKNNICGSLRTIDACGNKCVI